MRLLAMAAWVPRVVAFVIGVPGRLERLSLPGFLESITPNEGSRRGGAPHLPRLAAEEMVRVIWNVLRWDRGRFNHGCFMRSFARYHFLRAAGYPVVFNLGIEEKSRGSGPIETVDLGAPFDPAAPRNPRSHAWLTLDGRPFLEFEPARLAGYRLIYRYPGEPAPRRDAPGTTTAPPPPDVRC